MSKWRQEKEAVVAAARKLHERGLVVGTAGNVSVRLSLDGKKQLLAITPSSRPYESLSANDILVVDFAGQKVEGDLEPSMELKLHTAIYLARRNVNAIVHSHSVFASAAAVAGLEIPPVLDDQVVFLGGEIKLAGYALSGTPEQVTNTLQALSDRSAVLLANHGALATGRDIESAFTAAEIIEKTARIYLLALTAGSANTIPEAALKTEKDLYDSLQNRGD